jgi:hypothetical protein
VELTGIGKKSGGIKMVRENGGQREKIGVERRGGEGLD